MSFLCSCARQSEQALLFAAVLFLAAANTAFAASSPAAASSYGTPGAVFAWYIPAMGAYGSTVAAYKTEIQQAQAAGIDGFALDMFCWNPSDTCGYVNFQTISANMFEAALELGTNFKLFFVLDCQTRGAACPSSAGPMLTAYGNHPNYYYYSGRPVFSVYIDDVDAASGSADNTFTSAALNSAQSAGFNVFFMPTFVLPQFDANNPTSTYNAYNAAFNGWIKSLANGMIPWTAFIPSLLTQNNTAYDQVSVNNGLVPVSSVSSWFGILRLLHGGQSAIFLEYNGGEGLSSIWADIISNQKPPIVMLLTWNDYTESYMGPASQSDLAAVVNPSVWQLTSDYLFSHAAYTDLNRYFIQWYKSGVQPTWPDAMYVFYRIAPMSVVASSAPAGQTVVWNGQTYNPTLDDIYVTTILTAPATIRVTSGGNVTNTSVGAGLVHTRVPFTVGTQRFDLIRSGTTLIHIDGANVVSSLTNYYNANPISYYKYAPIDSLIVFP